MESGSAILLGGIFSLGFAVFHLFFWKLFMWKKDLASLTPLNRSIMQVLNICLTLVFLIFAYISLFHVEELLSTPLGRTLLALISAFWFLRAIQQIVFFGLRSLLSWGFLVVFLLGSGLYLYPLV